MPIKGPNQSNRVMDVNGYKGRKQRDYTLYLKDPQTYKTDREKPTGPIPKRNPKRK